MPLCDAHAIGVYVFVLQVDAGADVDNSVDSKLSQVRPDWTEQQRSSNSSSSFFFIIIWGTHSPTSIHTGLVCAGSPTGCDHSGCQKFSFP